MIDIIIINENEEKINRVSNTNRVDVCSILKLKPTKLTIKNYYLSGADYNKIQEYRNKIDIRVQRCYINGADNSFFENKEKKEKIIIKKISRFELMEI